MTKRSKVFFLAFLAGCGVILGSVVGNVAVHGEEYNRIVLSRQVSSKNADSGKRGSITDRNGTVLAYSNRVYTLILDPYTMLSGREKTREDTIEAIHRYFDISTDEIRELLKEKPDRKYERVLKEIPAEKVEAFNAENKDRLAQPKTEGFIGVHFEENYLRSYPFKTFAADVIGFATSANGGETGLEKEYDDVLTGAEGLTFKYVGEGEESKSNHYEASDGYNIQTTIDYGVQEILEKKLLAYNNEKRSANTGAIVYDPNSGEILGMASWPFFDLNDPRNEEATSKLSPDEAKDKSDSEKLYQLWNNFCVSRSYEPGSTFKSVTVASALEEGKAYDGEEFYCKGYKEVENFNIRCWRNYEGGHGTLDLEEALGDSCNVALMDIGFALGAERMVENQYSFGFGTRTGVDLPDETRGVLKDPETMMDSDIASNSFGQNLEVNMVQMVSAYAALINGGNYYQPHIVNAITDKDGKIVKSIDPSVVRRPVTKETSEHIKQYLKAGVEEYAVRYSKVEGYSMGGKTATAEKHPRDEKKWLVSVMSFAPVENPEFILYVVIDEPEGTTGGDGDGMDSQYLTKDIMTELLPYMGIKITEPIEGSQEDSQDGEAYEDLEESYYDSDDNSDDDSYDDSDDESAQYEEEEYTTGYEEEDYEEESESESSVSEEENNNTIDDEEEYYKEDEEE